MGRVIFSELAKPTQIERIIRVAQGEKTINR